MNDIKIKFDPFQDKCTISMNDAPLPRYSSLNSYVNKPLLDMASALLQTISDELNDDFALSIVGTQFEQRFLSDLRKNHTECVSFAAEEFGIGVELRERFESTQKIAEGLSVGINEEYRERVFSETTIKIDERLIERVNSLQKATLCVANNLATAKEMIKNYAGQLILCISEDSRVICLNGNKYIWCVKEDEMDESVEAVVERFAIPRFINQVSDVVKKMEDANIRESVDKQKKIDVSISVQMDTSAIEGDYITPVFSCSGMQDASSIVRIESSKNNVAEVRGTRLYAVREGRTEVRFYKDNEIDAFDVIALTIKPDNLVKTISLSVPNKIKIGNTYTIQSKYVPSDAPDFVNAKWTTDNRDIVEVYNDGTFKALAEGTATITVKAERASADVEVTVISGIEKINLSTEKIHMYIGEKDNIEITLSPRSALLEEISAKSSNPKVAEVIKDDMGNWTVVAKGIEANGKGKGVCKIIFFSVDGECQSTCDITVESTMARNRKKSGFLSRTAIFTVLAFVLQFVTKPLGYYCTVASAGFAVLLGLVGIVKNKSDALWQIILMLISGVIIALNVALLIGA